MPERRSSIRCCLLVVLACALPVLGASCGKEHASNRKTLTFAYWADFRDNQFWTTICEEFEKAHPDVDIVSNWIPGDYGRKMQLLMISDSCPDVIEMDDELFPSYAVRGFLEDLGPYMKRDAKEIRLDDMFERGLESFNYRGFQGGLPWDGNDMMIFYNKDLFDKEGLPYPKDGWTWDDFRRYARALTKDLDGDGRPDQYGSNIEFWFTNFEPFVWCWGGEILNKDNTRSEMHGPRVIEAAQFVCDMKFKDKSMAPTGSMEGIMTEAQLLTGRLGMTMGGSYMIQNLDAVKGGMRWDIAPMPYGPYGDRATRATFDGISIYAKAAPERKALAWEFIKFVISEQAQRYVGERNRGIPVHRSDAVKFYVHPDSGVDEMEVIKGLDYAKLTPVTPYYLKMRTETQPIFDDLNLGKETPAQAIPRLDSVVNNVLSQELERWGKTTP